jgi:hypothetical protein
MARIAALVPDLLFGSRVQAMLQAAGHDVDLLGTGVPPSGYDLLVVDLTADNVDPAALAGAGMPTLGFYAHVQPEVRDRAVAAGFDLVVPRSRMNREGADLAAGLLG